MTQKAALELKVVKWTSETANAYIKGLVTEFAHVFLGGGVIVITITILLSQMSNYKIWLSTGPPKSHYI